MTSTLAFNHPQLPCIRYRASVTDHPTVRDPFLFFLRKFFGSEVTDAVSDRAVVPTSTRPFTAVGLAPQRHGTQHTPARSHNCTGAHRVARQRTSGPTARSGDGSLIPCTLERSSIACRLLYGLTARLSNLGIATFTDRCAFFLIPGYFTIALPLL